MDRPWIEAGLKFAEIRKGDIPSLLVQRVARLKSRASLDQRFLGYLVRSPAFTEHILAVQTGTAVPHISARQIEDFSFTLPTLPIQKAVAEMLGALDDKIAANDQASRVARELMATIYSDAISSREREVALGDLCEIFDGPHATPKKTESGPWFLGIGSLVDGRLNLKESAHISDSDFKRWTRRVTPQFGDVLFSYETRLGDAALMPRGIRACLGRRMALLRPRPNQVDSRVLLQAYLNPAFQKTIKQRSIHGATVDRIPLTELPAWPISLPVNESDRLARTLGALDDLASANDRADETLAELRDALLPKLMSGEIRVRDAEKVVEDVT
jgi:type I restriction enzyme S subunit